MSTKSINVSAFVIDPDAELTQAEIENGTTDAYVAIESLRSDRARAQRALAKELQMITPHLTRVRNIALYLGLEAELEKELRRLAR
jgi:hypothetical protein